MAYDPTLAMDAEHAVLTDDALERGPQARRVPAFTTNWRFGGQASNDATAAAYDDTLFHPVTLPHTVVPLSWQDWDAGAWDGTWIYRRHFDLPQSMRGMRVFCAFEGVLTSANVVVNDVALGRHEGGYLPFRYELTDLMQPKDNVMAVLVDGSWQHVPPDGHPGGPDAVDYFQPAGIYREVHLEAMPAVFIDDVFAKPVDVLSSHPSIEVAVTLDVGLSSPTPATIVVELRDDAGRKTETSLAASLNEVGRLTCRGTLDDLGDIELWHVDRPQLYEVRTRLFINGVELHRHVTRIGLREAVWKPEGFFLNGKRLQIFGLNRHQIYPYVGHAMPRRVQRRDAEILKRELNCNMVRCSHYPQSRHFLDACDELGLMVWEEAPGWGFLSEDPTWLTSALRDIKEMVVRDRNRPSIVLWAGRLNETRNLPGFYRRTKAAIYELDGSRQTSGAMIHYATTDWLQDVFAFDDYAGDRINAFLRPPLLGVPYLVSECVGTLSAQPLYRRLDTPGTLAQQAIAHAQVHDAARALPGYTGVLGWLAFDYGSGNGNRYREVKTPGVADIFRIGKFGSLFYRSQVSPETEVVIEPAFVWGLGKGLPPQGPGQRAVVLSNCDRLEFYVGDDHVGTARPDHDAFPALDHPPIFVNLNLDPATLPELRMCGYVDNELVGTRQMSADRTRDRLDLTVDDSALVADGSDMTRLVFRAVDRHGNWIPYPEGKVVITVEGPGKLVGDNPFDFAASPGAGAVWLLTGREAGHVVVCAEHPVLGRATVTVSTELPAGETTTPSEAPSRMP